MAAVWSIINDALAMLKEPRPEMRMINVGLMVILVDWGTTRPTITQSGFTEAQHRYWPGGDAHKGNMSVVVKRRDSMFVSERKRQTEWDRQRVMKGSCVSERVWIKKESGRRRVGRESSFLPVLSWEIHPLTMNPSCQRMLIKNSEMSAFCNSERNATQFLSVGKRSFELQSSEEK